MLSTFSEEQSYICYKKNLPQIQKKKKNQLNYELALMKAIFSLSLSVRVCVCVGVLVTSHIFCVLYTCTMYVVLALCTTTSIQYNSGGCNNSSCTLRPLDRNDTSACSYRFLLVIILLWCFTLGYKGSINASQQTRQQSSTKLRYLSSFTFPLRFVRCSEQ